MALCAFSSASPCIRPKSPRPLSCRDAPRSDCSGVGYWAIRPILPGSTVVTLHPCSALQRLGWVWTCVLGAPDCAGVSPLRNDFQNWRLAHIHDTLLQQTEPAHSIEPAERLRRSLSRLPAVGRHRAVAARKAGMRSGQEERRAPSGARRQSGSWSHERANQRLSKA